MNYQKIYNQVIERAKIRQRPDCYCERHHILPRCLGGNNDLENIVYLTAREHFICHWLLCRIYPEKPGPAHAFWMMCKMKTRGQKRYTPSSRTYQEAKIIATKFIGELSSKRKHPPRSEEFCKNVSKRKLGTVQTKETREKISLTKTGSKRSEETKRKIGLAGKGRLVSLETREKLRLSRVGIILPPVSQQTRDKLSKASKGRKLPPISEKTREKLRSSHLGLTRSKESVNKFKETFKNKKRVQCGLCGLFFVNLKTHYNFCKKKYER